MKYSLQVQKDFIHACDQLIGALSQRDKLLFDRLRNAHFDFGRQRVTRLNDAASTAGNQVNGLGPEEVIGDDSRNRSTGQLQVGLVNEEGHVKRAVSFGVKVDTRHLSHLKSIDNHRVADCKAIYTLINGMEVFASAQRVKTFEVIHTQHEDACPEKDEDADFEFFAPLHA